MHTHADTHTHRGEREKESERERECFIIPSSKKHVIIVKKKVLLKLVQFVQNYS